MDTDQPTPSTRRAGGRLRAGAAVIAVAAAAAIATQVVPAFAQSGPQLTTVKPTVYAAKFVNQHVVLGPQSSATTLLQTKALPAGLYMITATVAAVIYPHDQIVCAVSNVPNTNDGVFGTAGNPADGTSGIYGTATMTDTIRVTAGQRLWLGCNSFNYGKGTYAGGANLEAVPVVRG